MGTGGKNGLLTGLYQKISTTVPNFVTVHLF